MIKAGLKSLMARKLRLVMSAFAIILGVSFVSGSFIFTDTLGRAFDGIVAGSVGDVVVRPEGAQVASGSQGSATIPASVVADLADVEGAARADGNVGFPGAFVIGPDGKIIGGQGAPALGVNHTGGPAADGREFGTLQGGRWPEAAGEVVLDTATAERTGYALGDTVPVLTAGEPPRAEPTLVGIVEFTGGTVGASVSVFETAYAQELFLGGQDVFNDVWVTRADGVSQEELRSAVEAVLPEGVEAVTGEAAAEEAENAIGQGLSFINTFLLVFAAVALVVGAFLIVNTFSILVAQRSRELALFRAIGATRRQVTRSVVLEAVVVGLIGSTLGLLLGVGLALGIQALFGRFGLDLSGTPLAFTWRPVVAAYVVGLLFTVVAAYLPARRAGAVPPVAAMRDDVVVAESSMHRRVVLGSVLLGLGVAGLAVGLFLPDAPRPLLFLGLGILFVLLGVALTSPILGRPLLAAFGAAYRRLFGTVGAMAHENSLRNPRRTAATASALMIGLTLVSMMSVFGASAKASIDQIIGENAVGDFVASNPVGQSFSPAITDRLAAVDGVGEVMRVRNAVVQVDGEDRFVLGVEPERITTFVPVAVVAGSFADLDEQSIAVTESADGPALGDVVTVSFGAASADLTVRAVYESNPLLAGGLVVGLDALAALGVEQQDAMVYLNGDGSVPVADLQAALSDSVADVPLVTVTDQAGYAEQLRAPIDQLLFIIYALLGLAVVIAVLGIVNTLALSVIERTREIGLLRAVGLSRRQLRRMIRLEAIVIAVLGAALGVGLGLAFGVAVQRSLIEEGFEVLEVPITQLGIFVALAAIVGVLAAWWPGRRAARLDVLRAIATE